MRKIRVGNQSHDWGPWTAARFPDENSRDEFLTSVAHAEDDGWGAEAMPADGRGAHVRWHLGQFLRLNDVAYVHGGRIVVSVVQHRIR